jgi:hypothetical protein
VHPQVSWILSRQAALAIVLAAGAGLFVDANAAVSVLIGGSIGFIANLGYVLRAMRMSSGSDPVKVYRAQAAGEGFKFLTDPCRVCAGVLGVQGSGGTAALSWVHINLRHLLDGTAEATLG